MSGISLILSRVQSNNENAFFALVRAGLWEKDVRLSEFGAIDFNEVYRLAEEQSVVGLVAIGLEHVTDTTVSKKDVLQFIGQTLFLEQQNQSMNIFIGNLVDKMRGAGIYSILVKGQEVAQCYERPFWRSSGDVDFFLSEDNYQIAKEYLKPLASKVEDEYIREKHLGMTIDSWVVELHGSLYSGLSPRIERELDDVYQDCFYRGNIRSWMNDNVQVFLLSAENDVFYVFTHILQHFYKGGIGLRQICDWCRLLWTYRDSLEVGKIDRRLHRAGLKTAWKAFASFAVDYLGMPIEAMPFYSSERKWKRKADRIASFIIEVGNFGHNRDRSYFEKYPYLVRKLYSFGRRCGDMLRHARIFPWDSMRFFPTLVYNGVRSAARGE